MTAESGAQRHATSFDVIVVGGRVAGASTAMLLARQGLRVLVLERAARGTDTLSTLALMRAGVLQLRRWGLLERVRAAGTPALRRTIVHYGDESIVVPVKEKAGVDELFAPRRTVLDPILTDAAAEAGADVRFGASVTDLIREGGTVLGVRGRDRTGRAFEARAPLVIGADGRHSVVARAVGAPATWLSEVSGAVLFGFWSGIDLPGYEWFYRPAVSAGIIPTNDGLALVWVGMSSARFMDDIRQDTEAGFRRIASEVGAGLPELVAAGRRESRLSGFPGMTSYLRRPWGPGWALVGDAGSFRDPLTGFAHDVAAFSAYLFQTVVGIEVAERHVDEETTDDVRAWKVVAQRGEWVKVPLLIDPPEDGRFVVDPEHEDTNVMAAHWSEYPRWFQDGMRFKYPPLREL